MPLSCFVHIPSIWVVTPWVLHHWWPCTSPWSRAPPLNQALQGMGGTPTSLRGCPSRRRPMDRQQFAWAARRRLAWYVHKFEIVPTRYLPCSSVSVWRARVRQRRGSVAKRSRNVALSRSMALQNWRCDKTSFPHRTGKVGHTRKSAHRRPHRRPRPMAAAAGGVSTSPAVWHHEVHAGEALSPWSRLQWDRENAASITASATFGHSE